MIVSRPLPVWMLPLAAVAAAVVGCGPTEQIEQYTVPKPHVLHKANHVDRDADDVMPVATGEREPSRMLAAVVPHGAKTWFFKLAGPPEAVSAQQENFESLVGSVHFAGDESDAEWTLPEGWTQTGGETEFRFATLQAESAGETLETTISHLPSAAAGGDEFLLANVNRWRAQLSLPPLSAAELPDATRALKLAGGGKATLVDFTGKAAAGGGPPFAPFAGRAGGAMPQPRPQPGGPSAESPIEYKAPAGWSPGRVGGMRKAAFVVEDGGRRVEVTAIDLAAAAGELLPNVNRWRGQIGLDEIDETQLKRDLQTIEVGGEDGWFVELIGPSDASNPQTILGVIVLHGDESWFFKLQGDSRLAEREKERFQEFVRSVEFRD